MWSAVSKQAPSSTALATCVVVTSLLLHSCVGVIRGRPLPSVIRSRNGRSTARTSSRSSTPRVEYTADPVTVRDEAVSLCTPRVYRYTPARERDACIKSPTQSVWRWYDEHRVDSRRLRDDAYCLYKKHTRRCVGIRARLFVCAVGPRVPCNRPTDRPTSEGLGGLQSSRR